MSKPESVEAVEILAALYSIRNHAQRTAEVSGLIHIMLARMADTNEADCADDWVASRLGCKLLHKIDKELDQVRSTQREHGRTLARIEKLLEVTHRLPSLGGHFEGFEEERTEPMPETITLPEAKDNQRWRVRILPRKADGHINASLTGVTWVSTDESVVGVLPGTQPFDFEDVRLDEAGNELWREVVTCPGFFRCKFLTPLASGTGVNVTVSAPGYDSAVFTNLTYSQGVPLSLNASFGEIESDEGEDPNW